MLNRRTLLFSAIATVPVLGLSVQSALAASKPPIFVAKGAAINGYDPIAYFDGGPKKGKEAHELTWRGALWRFDSAANMAKFEAAPESYAPQYGGYCAYAVANNYTASTDPDAWSVVDGKLYLNYSKGVRRRWERDIPGNIAAADKNWPTVLSA